MEAYTMPPVEKLQRYVPAELKAIDQWVSWTLKRDPKKLKPDKIPRNPHNGKYASSTDPATWGTFDQAVEAAVARGHNGVGFVLADGTPITGIDIDGCLDPATGYVSDEALHIVRALDSYTEVSPSGTGLRIFVQGRKNTQECRVGAVEVYNWGRFLTITGDKVKGTPAKVEARQAELDRLLLELFGAPSTEPGTPSTNGHEPPTHRSGKHTDSLITTSFTISPSAQPPFRKWAALCQLRPIVQGIFSHTNVARYGLAGDGTGPNLSKIEQALANYAIAAGWADQEVVDLLIAHRVAQGEAPKHLKYYQHTLTAAHDQDSRRKALEGATAPKAAHRTEGTGQDSEGLAEPSSDVLETPEDEEQALLGEGGKLSVVLRIRIDRLVKYDSEPPSFRMYTEHGSIYFPTVGKLIHQGFLKEQIANRGHIIPSIDKKEWPTIQQWLLDACEVVDAGQDATEEGQVRAWLQGYFAEHRIKDSFDQAVATKLPYKDGDQIAVFGNDLRAFIGSALKEFINAQAFGARLRAFGAIPVVVPHVKPTGERTSYHVWLLPSEYTP